MPIAMMKKSLIVLLLLVTVGFVACDKVTETGNPCPSGECSSETGGDEPTDPGVPISAPDAKDDLNWYTNDYFKITIGYPKDWNKSEQGSSAVEFISPHAFQTKATVKFESLRSPSSLENLVMTKQCVGSLSKFEENSNMEGYVCDRSAQGRNNGDAKEYYFLSGTVFIQISAEIFEQGRDGFNQIVTTIAPIS